VYYTSPITQVIQPGQGTVGTTQLQSGLAFSQWTSNSTAIYYNTGNVGVGTASPTGKLDVSSSSAGVTAGDLVVDTANKTVYVGRQSSTGGDNSYLVVRGRVNGTGTNQAISITGDTSPYGTGLFRPNNDILGFSTLATERMRIDSSGRLLVNLTSLPTSSARLNVGFNNNSGSYALNIYHTSSSYNDSAVVFYGHSNQTMGYIYCNGTTTQYSTGSDYRLKENIAPMTGALSKVVQLKPCTYTWKADGSNGQGFIAHELAEICPDAVSGEKDAVNGDGTIRPQGVDTSFLVATLTAAIQEQQALITQLQADVAELKGAK
jgi:hypothetical protein